MDFLAVEPQKINFENLRSHYLALGEKLENINIVIDAISRDHIEKEDVNKLSHYLRAFLFKYALRHTLCDVCDHMGDFSMAVAPEDINQSNWQFIYILTSLHNFKKEVYEKVIKDNIDRYIDDIRDIDEANMLAVLILTYIKKVDGSIMENVFNHETNMLTTVLTARVFIYTVCIPDYDLFYEILTKVSVVFTHTNFIKDSAPMIACYSPYSHFHKLFGDNANKITWENLSNIPYYIIQDPERMDFIIKLAEPPTEKVVMELINEKCNEPFLAKILAVMPHINYKEIIENIDESGIVVLLKYIELSDDMAIDIITQLNNVEKFTAVIMSREHGAEYLQKIFDILIKKGKLSTARMLTYQCQINIAESLLCDLFPRADILDKRRRMAEDDSICMICHADAGNCSGMFYFISCCNHIICDMCYPKIGHECPMCKKCNMQLAAIVD